MTINNALNTSQTDFQVTAGTYEFANRVRGKVGVENLGITYSGGTFSVTSFDGTALSITNPAYVTLPSKANPGQLKTIAVTADQSFIDDSGASEIIGNLFGLTTGIAYTEDIPFFIYAVLNDNEDSIAFMISRNPTAKTSPAAANIGAPDDAVADAQGDFFSFDSLDETLYDTNPCICIGSFRMQMSALDDWTVQSLGNDDGIGLFQEEKFFRLPSGVYGSASGTYWQSNAGTEPTFSSSVVVYKISTSGMVDFIAEFNSCNNTPAGANILNLTLPYTSSVNSSNDVAIGVYENASTGIKTALLGTINGGSAYAGTFYLSTTSTILNNASFSTNYNVSFVIRFSAFQ